MSAGAWVGLGVIVWCVVSLPVGLMIGQAVALRDLQAPPPPPPTTDDPDHVRSRPKLAP